MGTEYKGFLYAAWKDALIVEELYKNPELHCEGICFHSHQVAEKILKNVISQSGNIPQRTHDLDVLLNRAIELHLIKADGEAIESAMNLTSYAIVARYKTTPEIHYGEALKAIYDCNKIADMVERNGYQAIKIDVKVDLLRNQALAPEKDKAINQPRIEDKETTAREGAEHPEHNSEIKPDINKDDR